MTAGRYLGGRSPLMALIVWLICAAGGLFFWRSGVETFLLNQPLPRVVALVEIITIVGATMSALLMSAHLPVIDRLSVRSLGAYSGWTVTATIGLFGTIPLIPLVWVRLLPDSFPRGTFVDTSEEVVSPVEVYTANLVGSLATAYVFFAAISLLCIIWIGKILGTIATFAMRLLIVMAQSCDAFQQVIPLFGGIRDPFTFNGVALIWALVTTFLATLSWYKFRGVPRSSHE